MAKSNSYDELSVRLPTQEYSIFIGRGILDTGIINRFLHDKQVLIVTNEAIAPLYLTSLRNAFRASQCDVIVLPDGEHYKNSQSLSSIYDCLINNQHHRDTTLVALGGGVIGDITGFAASTYKRGVGFLQIPTTLLAQVDASIGGKTAINHPQAKNSLGSFYHPNAVFMDINTLSTLSPRHFRAGLAEIIKYALLSGSQLFAMVYEALENGLADDLVGYAQLTQLVSHCCRVKIKFVQEDEREKGQRALLNLGHTFAHALETYSQYDRWLHGEAVSIGIYCAALLSYQQGLLAKKHLSKIEAMLVMAKLPCRIPKGIDVDKLRGLMQQDKKIQHKKLRLVLIKAIGSCYIEDQVSEDCLLATIKAAIEGG